MSGCHHRCLPATDPSTKTPITRSPPASQPRSQLPLPDTMGHALAGARRRRRRPRRPQPLDAFSGSAGVVTALRSKQKRARSTSGTCYSIKAALLALWADRASFDAMTTLLARGRAADVYALDAGRVLKRDREGRDAAHEAAGMRHARAHGFPVPLVFEARGTELVMERVGGRTMTADLALRPWRVAAHARLLASLHTRLHQVPPPAELPSRLDGGTCMVHGDLHPDNVILGPGGAVVIDWANAGRGRAEDDIAMAWLIIAASDMPGGRLARLLAGVGRQYFLKLFLDAVGSEIAVPRLAVVGEQRLRDPHVLPHEADKLRRLMGGKPSVDHQ
jgi:streptomycin 6-kinase